MLVANVNPFNVFKFGLTGVFLFLDGIVYWAISKLFGIYNALAGAQIITQEAYQDIAEKFYVVIGVVMLFYLAYALLKTLINPDDLNKNVGKIATNLIVSLILLGVVPTIFSYAFELQHLIIEENIIDNLIFGTSNDTISEKGNKSAMNVLHAFLNSEDNPIVGDSGKTWNDFMYDVANEEDDTTFMDLTDFVEPVHNGDASYIPIISTLCGCFLAYVLVSFCIDLGIRVVKLAFYQIIAPIPILMRIVPEKKSVFDNWVKGSLATYMEVFIRLFIMYIIIFLVANVFNGNYVDISIDNGLDLIVNVVIILGLFAFAKQAPKLLSDVMGIDSGNIKLGIGGKLAAGGAFGLGAIAGAGITTGVQNLTHGVSNFIKAKGVGNKFSAAGRVLPSMLAGAVSGAARSAKGGFSAKNAKDMVSATSQGITAAGKARGYRESYRSRHGGNALGVAKGHLSDAGSKFKKWATGGAAGILGKVAYEEEFKGSFDDIQAIYENASYKAMDAQLEQYKAMEKAGNTTTQDGTPLKTAIETLEGNMLKARVKALQDNAQASAYAMYNIAQNAKRDPALAASIGIDVSMADNLQLSGNRVLDKSTGKEVEPQQLFEMFEGRALDSLRGSTYDKTADKFFDATGHEIDFTAVARNQENNKNGMRHQKKKATVAINADKVSIDYKEALKRQEANKK